MPAGYQPEEYLTVRQAARILQLTPLSVYRLINTSKIPVFTYNGRSIRIKMSDLIKPLKPAEFNRFRRAPRQPK